MDKKFQDVTKRNSWSKFFTLFKLIESIICFIPAIFIFGLGLVVEIIILIIGAGGAKLQDMDTSGLASVIGYSSILTLIPAMIAIIVFVLAIICCVKFLKNKYSKKMDIILTILLTVIAIFYTVILFNLSFVFLAIIALMFSIINIINIFYIIKL